MGPFRVFRQPVFTQRWKYCYTSKQSSLSRLFTSLWNALIGKIKGPLDEWTERTDDRCTRGHKSQILHFLKGVQYYRKSVRLLSTIIAYFRQHQSSLASFVGCYQRTLNVGGKYDCVAGLQFNKTATDQKEHMLLFVCSKEFESKLVELETYTSPNCECSMVAIIK